MGSTRPAGTESFKFNHTMLRVKDPKASLQFYQEVLGMELVDKVNAGDFTLYFLAFPLPGSEFLSPEAKAKSRRDREGILELTHNHGTESDSSFKGYHSGNNEPLGYGHIGISVEDPKAACDRLERLGVEFVKKLTDGNPKTVAFFLDPDGYCIEILPARSPVWT